MNYKKLLNCFLLVLIAGCGTGQSNTNYKNKLTLILLGYDSLACYYGNSDAMTGLRHGKISDSIFMQKIIKESKEYSKDSSFNIVLKPTASFGVGENFEQMVNLLNIHDLQNRSIDTLDKKEKSFFNRISLQEFIKENDLLHLNLPKDDNNNAPVQPDPNRLTILLSGEDGTYAYLGSSIQRGHQYSYKELQELISVKKSAHNFSIQIKPSTNSTYKNTVNALDLMTQENIEKYALIHISKEEEEYLKQLYKK